MKIKVTKLTRNLANLSVENTNEVSSKPKKNIFSDFCEECINYDKSMEWQDDEDDRKSSISKIDFYLTNRINHIFDQTNLVYSLSWSGKNILGRSRSDSNINEIDDCNYRTQGTQVSCRNCNTAKHVTSILDNLNLNDDDNADIIDDETPTMIIDYPTYNQFDYSSNQYGIKTKDVTTEETIIQKSDILNFQGNRHMPDEIAPYWKKDCRTWLWKSVRLAHRENEMKKMKKKVTIPKN